MFDVRLVGLESFYTVHFGFTPTHGLLTLYYTTHFHAPAPVCTHAPSLSHTNSQGILTRGSSTKAESSLTTQTHTHTHKHETHLLNDARKRPVIRSGSSSALRRDDRIDGSLTITTFLQARDGVAHKVHSHIRERLLRTLVPWPVVHTVIDTWWLSEAPGFRDSGAKSR